MRRVLLFAALALVATACIVEAPTKEGTQATAPRPPPAPPMEYRSGANFGDQVELVSATVNPSRASPGDSVRVSLNFRVLAPVDREYMIFVHVEDVDGRADRLNVDHWPRLKPTTAWQPGEMIRDDFEIPIPPQMAVRGLNLMLGFWDPRNDQRMPLKNRDQVRNDGRDRLHVATIPLTPAAL
jgi:hypothetical protein